MVDSPTTAPGKIFEEKYELLEELGRGGLGIVYKARQLDINRIVALKIIRDARSDDKDFHTRFIREAQILSSLSHLNIVQVFSVGLSSNNAPYMAMELVTGQTIRQKLNAVSRFSTLRALQITRDAANALAYLHQNGIIHRDIKTANIVLSDSPAPDTVKVIDFGLAKEASGASMKLTRTGELVGTPEFMSPEQCLGRPAIKESDIYSLILCFYEMLTGKVPYSSEEAGIGVLYKHLNDPIPELKPEQVERFHPILNEIIQKGLAKAPENRYQSMEELAQQLSLAIECVEDDKVHVSTSGGKKFSFPRKLLLPVSAAAACLLATTIFLSLPKTDNSSDELIEQPASQAIPQLENKIEHLISKNEISQAINLTEKVLKSESFNSWSRKDKYDFANTIISALKEKDPKSAVKLALHILRFYYQDIRLDMAKDMGKEIHDEEMNQRLNDLSAILLSLSLDPKQNEYIHQTAYNRTTVNGHSQELISHALYSGDKAKMTNFLKLVLRAIESKRMLTNEEKQRGTYIALTLAEIAYEKKDYSTAAKYANIAEQFNQYRFGQKASSELLLAYYYQLNGDSAKADKMIELSTKETEKFRESERITYRRRLADIYVLRKNWTLVEHQLAGFTLRAREQEEQRLKDLSTAYKALGQAENAENAQRKLKELD